MEDYEKLYKDVLAKAREIHRNENEKRSDMEWLFPELKESEDEKIRKEIINYFECQSRDEPERKGIHNRWIDWIEKQGESSDKIHYWTEEEIEPIINDYLRGVEHYGGMIGRLKCLKPKSLEKQDEQKPILDFKASNWYVSKVDGKIHDMTYNPADKVEPRFKVKYAGSEYNVLEVKDIAGVTFYGIEDEPNHIDYVKAENCEIISGYAIKENGSPYPTKPAVFSEKKPAAWSDEDENYLQSAENACEYQYGKNTSTILWLKSIKDRITWKPSKEQMEALDDALNERGFDYNDLNSLYEQLKKL